MIAEAAITALALTASMTGGDCAPACSSSIKFEDGSYRGQVHQVRIPEPFLLQPLRNVTLDPMNENAKPLRFRPWKLVRQTRTTLVYTKGWGVRHKANGDSGDYINITVAFHHRAKRATITVRAGIDD